MLRTDSVRRSIHLQFNRRRDAFHCLLVEEHRTKYEIMNDGMHFSTTMRVRIVPLFFFYKVANAARVSQPASNQLPLKMITWR